MADIKGGGRGQRTGFALYRPDPFLSPYCNPPLANKSQVSCSSKEQVIFFDLWTPLGFCPVKQIQRVKSLGPHKYWCVRRTLQTIMHRDSSYAYCAGMFLVGKGYNGFLHFSLPLMMVIYFPSMLLFLFCLLNMVRWVKNALGQVKVRKVIPLTFFHKTFIG